jgi:hypothetical protein
MASKVEDLMISELMKSLTHNDAQVRRRVAKALGRMGRKEAVPMLIVRMLLDEDPSVRQEAAHALGEIGLPTIDVVRADVDRAMQLADCHLPLLSAVAARRALEKIEAANKGDSSSTNAVHLREIGRVQSDE